MLPEAGARPPEFFALSLCERAPAFNLSPNHAAIEKMAAYLAELDLWRRRTNLTGPFESSELVPHALESALGQKLISHGIRLIDVGSGAGFPGVPLAIARPDASVTLLEPRKKRAAFLRHVLEALSLPNAEVLERRAQALTAAAYDLAAIRAVGDLPSTVGKARFLKPNGQLLAWTTDSRALADSLGGRFSLRSTLPVPGSDRRVIALFQKT